MNRTQIIEHKGKKIIFVDFSNLHNIEEIQAVAEESKKYVHAQPPKSAYTLTSVENTHFNNVIKDIFTELAKSNKPYVKAAALLGVTGLKQILFNGIMKLSGRDLKSFSSIDQAKDWLASDD